MNARQDHLRALALLSTLLWTGAAHANGYEAPVDLDKPAPPVPGGTLPFPLVEEPVPTAPAVGTKDLSRDAVYVGIPGLLADAELKNAAGAGRRGFEGVVVRQSRVAGAKATIPAGGLAYLAEVAPAAAPLEGARIGIGGAPRFLVDVEQTIVMRKGGTLPLGEPVVLGSSAIRFAAYLPLAGTASAGLAATSLAGYEWGRIGLGAFEISMTQPSWHSKIFRDGLVQGRIEEISPAFVRLAWLSATRTESIVVAETEVKGGLVKGGEEIPLDGGRRVKVTRVDPGRVSLETPDGAKTLSIEGDPKRLVEDTEARKKLVSIGKDYAVVCLPALSDFGKGQAYVSVYAKLHTYRRGEALDGDTAWRVYPVAFPTGHVLGVYVVNDKAIDLSPEQASVKGPAGAFQLVTTWAGGALETFGFDDAKGGHGPRVAGKGRTSIDLVAGGGPTIESVLGRTGIAPPPDATPAAVAPPAASAAPSPAPAPAAPSWRDDPVGFARPHLAWLGGGAVVGFLLAWLLGSFRRRPPVPMDY